MTTIKIDNKDYEFEKLPEQARAQIQMIQFVDNELQRLSAQSAVLQTARKGYSKALGEMLAALPENQGKSEADVAVGDLSQLTFG